MLHPRPTILCIYNTTLMTAACSRNTTRQPYVLYHCTSTIMGTHYNSIKSYCNYMYKICIYYNGVDKLLRSVSGSTVLLSGVRRSAPFVVHLQPFNWTCPHNINYNTGIVFHVFFLKNSRCTYKKFRRIVFQKYFFPEYDQFFFFTFK